MNQNANRRTGRQGWSCRLIFTLAAWCCGLPTKDQWHLQKELHQWPQSMHNILMLLISQLASVKDKTRLTKSCIGVPRLVCFPHLNNLRKTVRSVHRGRVQGNTAIMPFRGAFPSRCLTPTLGFHVTFQTQSSAALFLHMYTFICLLAVLRSSPLLLMNPKRATKETERWVFRFRNCWPAEMAVFILLGFLLFCWGSQVVSLLTESCRCDDNVVKLVQADSTRLVSSHNTLLTAALPCRTENSRFFWVE